MDWIGKNLYVVNSGARTILACPLAGGMCAIVLTLEDTTKPRDIVVYPKRG